MEQKEYKNSKSKIIIKITVEDCISAATCVVRAPNTFDLDENGLVCVKEGTWDEAEEIIEAAESCPTTAIIVEDLKGNQLYPKG